MEATFPKEATAKQHKMYRYICLQLTNKIENHKILVRSHFLLYIKLKTYDTYINGLPITCCLTGLHFDQSPYII